MESLIFGSGYHHLGLTGPVEKVFLYFYFSVASSYMDTPDPGDQLWGGQAWRIGRPNEIYR